MNTFESFFASIMFPTSVVITLISVLLKLTIMDGLPWMVAVMPLWLSSLVAAGYALIVLISRGAESVSSPHGPGDR